MKMSKSAFLWLVIFPITVWADVHPISDINSRQLSDPEARKLLYDAGYQDLASAWFVVGVEELSTSSQCVVDRKLDAYSKPIAYGNGLFSSQFVEMHADADISAAAQCQQLSSYEKTTQRKMAFSYRSAKILTPASFFDVDSSITAVDLLKLKKAIRIFQRCKEKNPSCTVKLKYLTSQDIASQYTNLVTLINLRAVSIAPSLAKSNERAIFGTFVSADGVGMQIGVERESMVVQEITVQVLSP